MNSRILPILLGVALFAGCARKEAKTAEDLKEAFEKPKGGGVALSTAPPEVKAWVEQAVTAIQKDDQVTAVVTLRSLRGSGQLSSDQALAVEDMMIKARAALSDRAARGDQQAIAALRMLDMNPR